MDAVDPVAAQQHASAPIPDLLRAAMGTKDTSAIMAFWNAYFRLPRWLMIARGEAENVQPFVVVAGDRPTLLVFSDAAGAQAIGRAAGLPEEDASKILALPMPDAVEWAASFAQHGVQAVQFDAHVDGGIVVPITNLSAMRNDLLGPPAGPPAPTG